MATETKRKVGKMSKNQLFYVEASIDWEGVVESYVLPSRPKAEGMYRRLVNRVKQGHVADYIQLRAVQLGENLTESGEFIKSYRYNVR